MNTITRGLLVLKWTSFLGGTWEVIGVIPILFSEDVPFRWDSLVFFFPYYGKKNVKPFFHKFWSSWLSDIVYYILYSISYILLGTVFDLILWFCWTNFEEKNLEPFWLLEGAQCHIDYSFFDCPFYSTWHFPWKWFKIDVWYIGAGKEALWPDFCRTQRDSIPNVRAMAGRWTALQVFQIIGTVFNLDCTFSPFWNVDCRPCLCFCFSVLNVDWGLSA